MKPHIEKLLYLIEKDPDFVYSLSRFQDHPYRPYDISDIRYLQHVVHTVQIHKDEHMVAEIIRILDLQESQEHIVRNCLAYDYLELVDCADDFGLSNLNSDAIFSLWEEINSVYFNLVFTDILDLYPHILSGE